MVDKKVCDCEKRNYPNTWKMRLALNYFHMHRKYEEESKTHPSYVCVHRVWLQSASPTDRDMWHYIGEPLKSIPLFSKRYALEKFMQMMDEYAVEDQPSLDNTLPISRIEVTYSDVVAHGYPKHELPPTYKLNA